MKACRTIIYCGFAQWAWLLGIGWVVLFTVEAIAQETVLKDTMKQGFLKDIPVGPGTLDISGSLRLRGEWLDHFTIHEYGAGESDQVLLERVRLNLDYQYSPRWHAFVQLQDAHYWLSDLQLEDFGPVCSYQNPLDLREAYIEWKRDEDSWFGYKLGRQTITYRDGRVWGPGDWGNTGRYTWDAAKLYVDTEFLDTDLIAAKQVISEKNHFDDSHCDFNAYGIYSRTKNWPVDLDVFYILKYDNEGIPNPSGGFGDLQSHAAGMYAGGQFANRLDWAFLGAYQFGKRADNDIEAVGLNMQLGYTWDVSWKPRLGVEYTYASGDNNPQDGKYQTFDGLFGGIDRFYGRMNFFSWMNLQDYQVSFNVRPVKQLMISVDYHSFYLASNQDAWYYGNARRMRQDASGKSGSHIGEEVDLLATWKMNPQVEIFSGYAHFFPGSFLADTGYHEEADWIFLQATWTF